MSSDAKSGLTISLMRLDNFGYRDCHFLAIGVWQARRRENHVPLLKLRNEIQDTMGYKTVGPGRDFVFTKVVRAQGYGVETTPP